MAAVAPVALEATSSHCPAFACCSSMVPVPKSAARPASYMPGVLQRIECAPVTITLLCVLSLSLPGSGQIKQDPA